MVSTGGDLFQWQRTWRGISTAHGQIDTHRCRYQRTAFNLLSVFTSLAVSSTPSMDILINTCFEHITALHISAREEISSSGACCWPMAHTVSHRDVLCLNLAWVLCCMSSSTLCPLIGPFCTVSYQKKAGVFLYCFQQILQKDQNHQYVCPSLKGNVFRFHTCTANMKLQPGAS